MNAAVRHLNFYPRQPNILSQRADGWHENHFFPTLEAPDWIPSGASEGTVYPQGPDQPEVIVSGHVLRDGWFQ